jgi:hypothetical protein
MICEKQEHLEKVFHDGFPKLEAFLTKSNTIVCGRFFLLQLISENCFIFTNIFTICMPENAGKNFSSRLHVKLFGTRTSFYFLDIFVKSFIHCNYAVQLLSNWLKIYLDVVISTV